MPNFGSPTESSDMMEYSDVLFYKYRPNYLDCLPPFDTDLFQLFSPPHGTSSRSNIDKDQKKNLVKLQVSFKDVSKLLIIRSDDLLIMYS